MENRPLITEDWLRASGFKWEQLDRQPSKHWLLWIASACIDPHERRMFASSNDLGIELAFSEPEPSYWFCWVRADYAGRYSRFLHVRHMLYQDEVVRLIEAMTGREWQADDAMYGALHAPEYAKRLRQQSEELHQRMAREWGPRALSDTKKENDPSQIGIIGRDL